MKESRTIQITGMTCNHCVHAVRSALEHVGGVTVNDVVIGSAEVTYDPAEVAEESIVDAIETEGYSVGPTQLKRG